MAGFHIGGNGARGLVQCPVREHAADRCGRGHGPAVVIPRIAIGITLDGGLVIALSASVLPEDRQRAIDAGCDDFESKPVDFPRLLMKMEQLLRAGDR